MNALTQDIRYALRSLLRQPGFALTAVLTLALGVGAATAIFSVFHGVLLKPLPFERPDRIVAVLNQNTETGARWTNASGPDFHDWKAQSRSFAALGYYTGGETSVTRAGRAQYVLVYAVTPGFLEALGATAAEGRLFTDADHQPNAPESVVITHAYRQREFGDA
jgi:putative ABC transport system permease protein